MKTWKELLFLGALIGVITGLVIKLDPSWTGWASGVAINTGIVMCYIKILEERG